MAGKPEGYVDVAERIAEFRQTYPMGSLQQVSVEFLRDFGGKDWVVYIAACYRTPDDVKPGIGTAWEPVPGPTNFTRDSEVQNAETAAWGRAMVATLAVDAKTIASKQEVLARTSPVIPPTMTAADVQLWADALHAAGSRDELQAVWESAGRAGATSFRAVVDAKDAQKAVLS